MKNSLWSHITSKYTLFNAAFLSLAIASNAYAGTYEELKSRFISGSTITPAQLPDLVGIYEGKCHHEGSQSTQSSYLFFANFFLYSEETKTFERKFFGYDVTSLPYAGKSSSSLQQLQEDYVLDYDPYYSRGSNTKWNRLYTVYEAKSFYIGNDFATQLARIKREDRWPKDYQTVYRKDYQGNLLTEVSYDMGREIRVAICEWPQKADASLLASKKLGPGWLTYKYLGIPPRDGFFSCKNERMYGKVIIESKNGNIVDRSIYDSTSETYSSTICSPDLDSDGYQNCSPELPGGKSTAVLSFNRTESKLSFKSADFLRQGGEIPCTPVSEDDIDYILERHIAD